MFDNLLNSHELDTNKNYWYIRTDKGRKFDSFRVGSFIGINWNYITLNDLKTKTNLQLREKIAMNERDEDNNLYDTTTLQGKKHITSVFNKIQRFKSLQKGDYVMMPNRGSKILSFGYISDNQIYEEHNDLCDYHKRRRVTWVDVKRIEELDPIFYKIVYSMHALSNLNPYAKHIDKIVKSVFVKGERAHLVFEINEDGDIPDTELTSFIDNLKQLNIKVNNELGLNENLANNSIRLNLQSPGIIEYLSQGKKSLVIVGILLGLNLSTACYNGNVSAISKAAEKKENIELIEASVRDSGKFTQNEEDKLIDFAKVNYDTIAETKANLDKIKGRIRAHNN